jgi:hypothetical protein
MLTYHAIWYPCYRIYLHEAAAEQISIYSLTLTEYHFRKPYYKFHENTYRTNWKHSP